jgi:hypothetical protein
MEVVHKMHRLTALALSTSFHSLLLAALRNRCTRRDIYNLEGQHSLDLAAVTCAALIGSENRSGLSRPFREAKVGVFGSNTQKNNDKDCYETRSETAS